MATQFSPFTRQLSNPISSGQCTHPTPSIQNQRFNHHLLFRSTRHPREKQQSPTAGTVQTVPNLAAGVATIGLGTASGGWTDYKSRSISGYCEFSTGHVARITSTRTGATEYCDSYGVGGCSGGETIENYADALPRKGLNFVFFGCLLLKISMVALFFWCCIFNEISWWLHLIVKKTLAGNFKRFSLYSKFLWLCSLSLSLAHFLLELNV